MTRCHFPTDFRSDIGPIRAVEPDARSCSRRPLPRGGVDVRGGGTGTREIETLSPLVNAEGPTAVLLTGGSAFGLAAADGVARWLDQRGLGRPTPMGVVPLVSTAVVYDLTPSGEGSGRRPGPDDGFAACENARAGVPERGSVGAGAGAAVGKLFLAASDPREVASATPPPRSPAVRSSRPSPSPTRSETWSPMTASCSAHRG